MKLAETTMKAAAVILFSLLLVVAAVQADRWTPDYPPDIEGVDLHDSMPDAEDYYDFRDAGDDKPIRLGAKVIGVGAQMAAKYVKTPKVAKVMRKTGEKLEQFSNDPIKTTMLEGEKLAKLGWKKSKKFAQKLKQEVRRRGDSYQYDDEEEREMLMSKLRDLLRNME